jgi:hypothetical protein
VVLALTLALCLVCDVASVCSVVVEVLVVRVWLMGLQADGAQCVVCESSDCEGAGGGSDACNADVCTLVCCDKQGGREMLGLQ